jgi:hypothetical protein
MKVSMRVTQLGREIADFSFNITNPSIEDLRKLFEIEYYLNERTDVRFHISPIGELRSKRVDKQK